MREQPQKVWCPWHVDFFSNYKVALHLKNLNQITLGQKKSKIPKKHPWMPRNINNKLSTKWKNVILSPCTKQKGRTTAKTNRRSLLGAWNSHAWKSLFGFIITRDYLFFSSLLAYLFIALLPVRTMIPSNCPGSCPPLTINQATHFFWHSHTATATLTCPKDNWPSNKFVEGDVLVQNPSYNTTYALWK